MVGNFLGSLLTVAAFILLVANVSFSVMFSYVDMIETIAGISCVVTEDGKFHKGRSIALYTLIRIAVLPATLPHLLRIMSGAAAEAMDYEATEAKVFLPFKRLAYVARSVVGTVWSDIRAEEAQILSHKNDCRQEGK